jgi:hypothetical protein
VAKETERRRWERLALSIPVFAQGQDESGEEFVEFTTILNISVGGALLLSRRSLPISSQISLHLLSTTLSETASEARFPPALRERSARVVRAEVSDGHHLLGLEFVN